MHLRFYHKNLMVAETKRSGDLASEVEKGVERGLKTQSIGPKSFVASSQMTAVVGIS